MPSNMQVTGPVIGKRLVDLAIRGVALTGGLLLTSGLILTSSGALAGCGGGNDVSECRQRCFEQYPEGGSERLDCDLACANDE